MPLPGPPPTPQQLAALPQWAQRHIEKIAGERDVAIQVLRRFEDKQAKTNTFYDEMACIGNGHRELAPNAPTSLRCYVPATRIGFTVATDLNGDDVEVMLYHNEEDKRLEISLPRDFSHMCCYGPGQLHILHSPYVPFSKRNKC
jgi:hypothetical protein